MPNLRTKFPTVPALSQVRAWVEHPFRGVKNLFRHKKLRYRGIAKNTAQLKWTPIVRQPAPSSKEPSSKV
jgi:IS5 family transposase